MKRPESVGVELLPDAVGRPERGTTRHRYQLVDAIKSPIPRHPRTSFGVRVACGEATSPPMLAM